MAEGSIRQVPADVDLDVWLTEFATHTGWTRLQPVRAAAALAREREAQTQPSEHRWTDGSSCFRTGLDMADILRDLRVDQDTVVAAVLYRAVREEKIELAEVDQRFGTGVATLIDGVLRMAAAQGLQLTPGRVLGAAREEQVEHVRRMLVALVDDVRVALVKLAERACAVRAALDADLERQQRVAREVLDVYAPLANRLGIGQLKWELEDLAFRNLEPEAYGRIARLLDERRAERDGYVDEVMALLNERLAEADVHAEVQGRAKHIYSIWRKMQRKGIDFDQVYDVRGVRLLVNRIGECYASLGVVHSLWRHIPREFDDYIANPKENGYRSIHTAVIGLGGKVLEVQIRTWEMHQEAELGVCAHWAYKGEAGNTRGDEPYEEKLNWLRQVLEWHEELGDLGGLAESLRRDFQQERIYVFTPDGHVVDLVPGATPVDFAYRVHTEVGHRCRGAKVDGRVVPLSSSLENGQVVEVLTAEEQAPSRDWLNPNLGFIHSSRARAKVQAWFRAQDREHSIANGRRLLADELRRLDLGAVDAEQLAPRVGYAAADDMAAAIATGDLDLNRVLAVAEHQHRGEGQLPLLPAPGDATRVQVLGAAGQRLTMAACCHPVPGDPIGGYADPSGGVTVHRRDCQAFLAHESRERGRVIAVSWGAEPTRLIAVDLVIEAHNRPGLLRDITQVLAVEDIDLVNVLSTVDREHFRARVDLTIEVSDLEELTRVMDRIAQVSNVIGVQRVGGG